MKTILTLFLTFCFCIALSQDTNNFVNKVKLDELSLHNIQEELFKYTDSLDLWGRKSWAKDTNDRTFDIIIHKVIENDTGFSFEGIKKDSIDAENFALYSFVPYTGPHPTKFFFCVRNTKAYVINTLKPRDEVLSYIDAYAKELDIRQSTVDIIKRLYFENLRSKARGTSWSK